MSDLYDRAAKAGYSAAAVSAATRIEWELDALEAANQKADSMAADDPDGARAFLVYEVGGRSDVILGFCATLAAECGDAAHINAAIKAVRKEYGYRRTADFATIRAAALEAIRARGRFKARGRGDRESLRNDFN